MIFGFGVWALIFLFAVRYNLLKVGLSIDLDIYSQLIARLSIVYHD